MLLLSSLIEPICQNHFEEAAFKIIKTNLASEFFKKISYIIPMKYLQMGLLLWKSSFARKTLFLLPIFFYHL